VHATLLQVQGLHKAYRVGKSCVPALQEVSFQVRAGEIVALLGSNGSGKTTRCKPFVGALVYQWCERRARQLGLLGWYA